MMMCWYGPCCGTAKHTRLIVFQMRLNCNPSDHNVKALPRPRKQNDPDESTETLIPHRVGRKADYCDVPTKEYDEGCVVGDIVLGEPPEMKCHPPYYKEVAKVLLIGYKEVKDNGDLHRVHQVVRRDRNE